MTEHLQSSSSGTVAAESRYCQKCGYDLRGTVAAQPRCPECGRPFDTANPKTFRRRPIRRWVRHVRRAACAIMAMLLVLAAVWGWFYWGWWEEQRAIKELRGRVYVEPLSPWVRGQL